MSDIELARVKIAAMRAAATPGPWGTTGEYDFPAVYAGGVLLADVQTGDADAALIVTMLDPDFLDALDGMLATAACIRGIAGFTTETHADRIASAFLAAADRVQA